MITTLLWGTVWLGHARGQVSGFLPSTSAFRFDNRHWPSVPNYSFSVLNHDIKLGDAALGLCGGMSFAVRDLFEAKHDVPVGETPPKPGTALFNYLVADLARTFTISNVNGFLSMMQAGDTSSALGKGLGWRIVREEWPLVKGEIDAGLLSPVGLVAGKVDWGIGYLTGLQNLSQCHQVLAYGYTQDGSKVSIKLYDPNFPGDNQTLSFDTGNPDGPVPLTITGYSAGTFRGFFREEYSYHNPNQPISFQFGHSVLISSPGI